MLKFDQLEEGLYDDEILPRPKLCCLKRKWREHTYQENRDCVSSISIGIYTLGSLILVATLLWMVGDAQMRIKLYVSRANIAAGEAESEAMLVKAEVYKWQGALKNQTTLLDMLRAQINGTSNQGSVYRSK